MTCGQLPVGGCWLPLTHEGKCINPEVAQRVLDALAEVSYFDVPEVDEGETASKPDGFMRVTIQLTETAQGVELDDVVNAYTKGPFYCVYRSGGVVQKFPLTHIWRVTETY